MFLERLPWFTLILLTSNENYHQCDGAQYLAQASKNHKKAKLGPYTCSAAGSLLLPEASREMLQLQLSQCFTALQWCLKQSQPTANCYETVSSKGLRCSTKVGLNPWCVCACACTCTQATHTCTTQEDMQACNTHNMALERGTQYNFDISFIQ